jgi:hypothetical protein
MSDPSSSAHDPNALDPWTILDALPDYLAVLGARVMLTGIRPEVAQAIVDLGVDLSSIETRASLQDGIAATLGRVRASPRSLAERQKPA